MTGGAPTLVARRTHGYPLLGGVVRTHHSPAITCRLKAIQNAAAKLS